MTPARKAALQWFHDQGEIICSDAWEIMPCKIHMVRRMLDDGQLSGYTKGRAHVWHYSVTYKGRRMLHGDAV